MYEKTYQTRVLKQNEKTTVKNKQWFSWKRFFILVIIIGIIGGVVYLFKQPKLQVVNIKVFGTTVIDEQDVSSSIREQLVGKWMWFFPKTSIFLINDKKIEHNLKKNFSRIETISIKRTNFNTLVATIKEFEAVYLWCLSDNDCYFMDKQGIVYSNAPVFSGTAYIKIFTGAPIDQLPFLGMKNDDLSRVAEIKERLSAISIVPTAFHAISPRELKIDFMHNKSLARLIVDPTVPTDTSLEYLFSGIRTEPLSSLFHDQQKELLYIDVRFSNKVVYKFQP